MISINELLSIIGSLASTIAIIWTIYIWINSSEIKYKKNNKKTHEVIESIVENIDKGKKISINHLRMEVVAVYKIENSVFIDEVLNLVLEEIISSERHAKKILRQAAKTYVAFQKEIHHPKSENFKDFAFKTAVSIIGLVVILLIVTTTFAKDYELFLLRGFFHPIPIIGTGVFIGISSVIIGWLLAEHQSYLDQKYLN